MGLCQRERLTTYFHRAIKKGAISQNSICDNHAAYYQEPPNFQIPLSRSKISQPRPLLKGARRPNLESGEIIGLCVVTNQVITEPTPDSVSPYDPAILELFKKFYCPSSHVVIFLIYYKVLVSNQDFS